MSNRGVSRGEWRLLACLLSLMVLRVTAYAQVGVSPQYLFYEPERKSVPITVSNPTDATMEVSCAAMTGYATSDDSGKTVVVYDSSDATIPSAARWVQFYPSHFILGPKEAQTVRIVATPQPGAHDGEYWARLAFTSRPSKNPTIKKGSGMTLLQRVAIPFHYRLGRVTTGLEIANVRATSDSKLITIRLDATRTGNAAYWGSATARLLDKNGGVVSTATRKIAIYRTYTVKILLDREKISSGDYTIDIRLETGNRGDVPDNRLVKGSPAVTRTDISLR